MAPRAVAAELAAMNVVAAVAGDALLRQACPLVQRLLMTGAALQTSMRTIQGELSPGIVIEAPDTPVIRVVALGARVPQSTPVNVLIPMTLHAALGCVAEAAVGMARLAGHRGVQTDQWKAREVMVEGKIRRPCDLAVAALAVGAECTGMHVVAAVAGIAGRIQPFFGQYALVAGCAVQAGVRAPQREIGSRVVETHLGPPHRIVAVLTHGAVTTVVYIVAAVAGHALRLQGFAEIVANMARLAADIGVSGRKGEASLPQVIERGLFPGLRGMTVLAGSTAAAVVHIVHAVARHTLAGRLLVALGRVAEQAVHGGVRTGQGIFRRARVIEPYFSPSRLLMTAGAIFAERPAMRVLISMAAVARCMRLAMLASHIVATLAGRTQVRPSQRKIRARVVEGLRIKTHDVCLSALMIRMAVGALTASCRLEPPVKTLLRPNVGCDFVVTVEAKATLGCFVERRMTAPALRLIFRMAGDHGPGHYQAFEVDRPHPQRDCVLAQHKHDQ